MRSCRRAMAKLRLVWTPPPHAALSRRVSGPVPPKSRSAVTPSKRSHDCWLDAACTSFAPMPHQRGVRPTLALEVTCGHEVINSTARRDWSSGSSRRVKTWCTSGQSSPYLRSQYTL